MKKLLIFVLFMCPFYALSASSYWIVQNIGTLTLRVYEKQCDKCKASMILQSQMVAGKNEFNLEKNESYKTLLGYYKIDKWHKFYTDQKENYISWNGRKTPKRGSTRTDWGIQGVFGVYTATLTPNKLQHLHGTIGWPNESLRFVLSQKSKNGTITTIGSKGCTRVDNQTIMFLRNFIPEKTPVIRIYALETKKETKEIVYKIWPYLFYETTDLNNELPLDYSNRKLIKEENILEVGTFTYLTTPLIRPLIDKSKWNKFKANGNPYEIDLSTLKGSFDIETGLLSKDYIHPLELETNNINIPERFFKQ